MLDPRLLRAFVAILDAGSFTRAAERLNMTQSTISQQLQRLEEALGQPLVEREERPVCATPAGERFLGYARRILALQTEARLALADPAGSNSIRIGLPEDIFSGPMVALFRDFSRAHRSIRLDVAAGLSRDLSRRYRTGELDIVVVKEPAASADCRLSLPEPLGWFQAEASEDWPDPMPLVVFPPGGLYRKRMFDRIERARRRWYVAFSGSSLPNVLVAVEAGMGISLLPCATTIGRRVVPLTLFGEEPAMALSVYAWDSAGPARDLVARMAEVLRARAKAPYPF